MSGRHRQQELPICQEPRFTLEADQGKLKERDQH
jgi:hypothetical protein